MSIRISVSVPDDLKDQIDKYNNENPCEKINISQETQKALYRKLLEVTRSTELKVTA
jgi:hypothetical protein